MLYLITLSAKEQESFLETEVRFLKEFDIWLEEGGKSIVNPIIIGGRTDRAGIDIDASRATDFYGSSQDIRTALESAPGVISVTDWNRNVEMGFEGQITGYDLRQGLNREYEYIYGYEGDKPTVLKKKAALLQQLQSYLERKNLEKQVYIFPETNVYWQLKFFTSLEISKRLGHFPGVKTLNDREYQVSGF